MRSGARGLADTAREKEKREERDVLCPVALDDSWKAKMEDVLWCQALKNVIDFLPHAHSHAH